MQYGFVCFATRASVQIIWHIWITFVTLSKIDIQSVQKKLDTDVICLLLMYTYYYYPDANTSKSINDIAYYIFHLSMQFINYRIMYKNRISCRIEKVIRNKSDANQYYLYFQMHYRQIYNNAFESNKKQKWRQSILFIFSNALSSNLQ